MSLAESPPPNDSNLPSLICGVCGGYHPVNLAEKHHVCPTRNLPYDVYVANIRAHSSRGDKRTGVRYHRIRAVHFGREDLWEWSSSYGKEVEAASGDQFALIFVERRIHVFHNLTVRTSTLFATVPKPMPAWAVAAIVLGVFAIIGLLAYGGGAFGPRKHRAGDVVERYAPAGNGSVTPPASSPSESFSADSMSCTPAAECPADYSISFGYLDGFCAGSLTNTDMDTLREKAAAKRISLRSLIMLFNAHGALYGFEFKQQTWLNSFFYGTGEWLPKSCSGKIKAYSRSADIPAKFTSDRDALRLIWRESLHAGNR